MSKENFLLPFPYYNFITTWKAVIERYFTSDDHFKLNGLHGRIKIFTKILNAPSPRRPLFIPSRE